MSANPIGHQEKSTLHVSLEKATRERVVELAKQQGITKSLYVEQALETHNEKQISKMENICKRLRALTRG